MQKKAKAGAGVGTLVLVVAVIIVRAMTSSGTTPPPDDTDAPPADARQRGADSTPAPRSGSGEPADDTRRAGSDADSGADELARLVREHTSDVMITVSGRVSRSLADDNEGSRHQKFIVEVSPGQTVLVAHNIDLADRVPLSTGDAIRVRGEYEWSERGGTLHWTHHDPQQWREGGWIEHKGKRYE